MRERNDLHVIKRMLNALSFRANHCHLSPKIFWEFFVRIQLIIEHENVSGMFENIFLSYWNVPAKMNAFNL